MHAGAVGELLVAHVDGELLAAVGLAALAAQVVDEQGHLLELRGVLHVGAQAVGVLVRHVAEPLL